MVVGGTSARSTRAVFRIGGHNGIVNSIQYVEIMTTGNAFDFGDLLNIYSGLMVACSSPTRGLFAGGKPSSFSNCRIDVDYNCIKGNSVEIW